MDPAALFRPRPEEARKGDFGRVVVAGGSARYAGAPAFNALAALRAGADLATVVAPRRAADIIAGYAPDLITVPCDTPHPNPVIVREVARDADAIVVGGGVASSDAAHAALRVIIRDARVPLVLDAEAMHAVAAEPDVLHGKRAVLTPHGGEFRTLTRADWPDAPDAREDAARGLAATLGCTVLVKGARDVISDGERVHVDEEGSPFLTKGGYGDLVAGAAGALLARGHEPFDAACGAAWLVGRAGAIAAQRHGEGTLASDALSCLAEATRQAGRVSQSLRSSPP